MAIRYCKNVKIDCKLVPAPGWPHGHEYKCALYTKGSDGRERRMWDGNVGIPQSLSHAIDSPLAYDKAAHAALSFAVDENDDIANHLEYTDSGFAIRRQKAYRHTVGPRGGGSYR